MKNFLTIFLISIISHSLSAQTNLSADVIKNLFGIKKNEDDKTFSPKDITFHEGSFTKKGEIEAVVSFYDNNQSHASGWSEIWLLKYSSKWRIDKKIFDGDILKLEVIDIEGDGVKELWLSNSYCGQGACELLSKLISLNGTNEIVMYSYEGFNYEGAMPSGEVVNDHKVSFFDIDGNGVLELLDLEVKNSYKWTGDKFASDYIETSSISKSTIYKFSNGKFIATKYREVK